MSELKIVEAFAPFGALVECVDFRRPSAQTTAEVKRALAQHHVLVSRSHARPGDDDITRFFEGFGELSSRTPEVKAHFARLAALVPEYLENGAEEVGTRFTLSNVEEDGKKVGGLGNRELEWHNDQADLPRLKTISCLEALEFEEGAGNTFFCRHVFGPGDPARGAAQAARQRLRPARFQPLPVGGRQVSCSGSRFDPPGRAGPPGDGGGAVSMSTRTSPPR